MIYYDILSYEEWNYSYCCLQIIMMGFNILVSCFHQNLFHYLKLFNHKIDPSVK
jgi:hypothetical protein